MTSIYVNSSGRDFYEALTFDANNCVIEVKKKKYPTLANVQPGMILGSINGSPVTKAKEEVAQYKSYSGEILAVFLTTKKDEFDLSSDEDADDTFKPNTALPPLPAEYNNTVARSSAEAILNAAEKAGSGKCIVVMTEGANPALPITLAAQKANIDVMFIDTVARMKTRQSMDEAGDVFKRSLEKGLWIYVEQATKSISLLRKLAECILEVEAKKSTSPKSRVFLMCEPHPHFPESLMKNCITLRCRLQGNNAATVDVKEDLLESKRRRDMIYGSDGSVVNIPKPEVTQPKAKKVRISNEVNIVQMEKNTFMEMSASAHPVADRDNIVGEGLVRVAKYSFGSSEKFISLCKVNENRFAVGTNSGYVVLLDSDGLPLIQFRPHKACVWDISFASQFDFATACEDGTSTIFNYYLASQELTANSVASFQSDVFAVTYADSNDINSPVLSGGLSATICVLHSDRQNSSFIASGTSIQAMSCNQNKKVIVGGGNGTCSLIDPGRCVVMDSTNSHSRKVPAVSCYGDVAITGGFDRMLRLWDVRSDFKMINEKTISEVVTAVAVSDRYASACSGSDLIVWDLRKMANPLATKHNAWKDLTRGLVIEGNMVVTASVDGVTRFWKLS